MIKEIPEKKRVSPIKQKEPKHSRSGEKEQSNKKKHTSKSGEKEIKSNQSNPKVKGFMQSPAKQSPVKKLKKKK